MVASKNEDINVFFAKVVTIQGEEETSFEVAFSEYPTYKQFLSAFNEIEEELEDGETKISNIIELIERYGWPELETNVGYVSFGENEALGYITIRLFPVIIPNSQDIDEIKIGIK